MDLLDLQGIKRTRRSSRTVQKRPLARMSAAESKAREHLTTAATMYREMDMTNYFKQAETEISAGPEQKIS